ncbi:MAG TPA: hypothetical protein DC006_01435 [Prevotellaceae bacterium]|nr:hypothetical protein [Prevotellaceae bacterium]
MIWLKRKENKMKEKKKKRQPKMITNSQRVLDYLAELKARKERGEVRRLSKLGEWLRRNEPLGYIRDEDMRYVMR